MLLNGHVMKAFLCFIQHRTLIGGVPAASWGVASLNEDRARRRQQVVAGRLAAELAPG